MTNRVADGSVTRFFLLSNHEKYRDTYNSLSEKFYEGFSRCAFKTNYLEDVDKGICMCPKLLLNLQNI